VYFDLGFQATVEDLLLNTMDIHDLLTGHHGYAASAGVDAVFVRDVRINANIGPDAWGRNKMQPLLISATIPYAVQQAGASDNIELTLDYRKVYKAIRLFDVGENEDNVLRFRGPMELANDIFTNLKAKDWARLDITAPKALLHTQGITMRWFGITYPRPNPDEQEIGLPSSTLSVNAMQIPCIIGIGDHERLHKQPVVVDFAVDSNAAMDEGRSIALRFRDVFNVSSSFSCDSTDD
jgi:FolB domain-containing protein